MKIKVMGKEEKLPEDLKPKIRITAKYMVEAKNTIMEIFKDCFESEEQKKQLGDSFIPKFVEIILANLNIPLETTFDKSSTNIAVENINKFANNLDTKLAFASEEIKNKFINRVVHNIDYYVDGETVKACIDLYDWNDIGLYTNFVRYQLTGEEPNSTLLEDTYFGEHNKQSFEDFKNGKHSMFKFIEEQS